MAKATAKWNEYEHVAWSVGYCAHSKNLEAVRVQDVVAVTAIYFIPVRRRVVGRRGICDFCERPFELAGSLRPVDRAVWTPRGGLANLMTQLGVDAQRSLPEVDSDVRLGSLLSATEEASALKNVNILAGMIVGLLAGVALAIPLGVLLFDRGVRVGAPDRFGAGVVASLVGAVLGSIIGAGVWGWMIRSRVAARKVVAACRDYPLDLVRLGELARGYNRHVQHAVGVATLERT